MMTFPGDWGFLLIVFAAVIDQVLSVGCYTCSSFNNSDPGCADPFNPAYSTYVHSCRQGKKDRVGLFPAPFCIKMDGVSLSTGIEITVRTCSLMNMNYQCGIFDFEKEKFKGCLATCTRDACNGYSMLGGSRLYFALCLLSTMSLTPLLS